MLIGILGGTFNPIHNAHLELARQVKKEFCLDKVLLMVAADPPHKTVKGGVCALLRLKMTEAAASNENGIEASGLELMRGGKSYTADTLMQLKGFYPEAGFFLIVGGDMLKDFPSWRESSGIAEIAHIIGVPRKGMPEDIFEQAKIARMKTGARISVSKARCPEISSTLVRERVFHAKPVSELVAQSVQSIIYETGVYFPENIRLIQEKLKDVLNKKRYRHTMNTVLTAVELADRYGIDPEKARLAALLHDCAKTGEPPLELAERLGVEPDDWERAVPDILHARLGAIIAREEYGVKDADTLQAIAAHTTGGTGMSDLDKVIYLSDMIEPGRDFPGVDEIRDASWRGLNRAVVVGMERSLNYCGKLGKRVHPATLEAKNEIQYQEDWT